MMQKFPGKKDFLRTTNAFCFALYPFYFIFNCVKKKNLAQPGSPHENPSPAKRYHTSQCFYSQVISGFGRMSATCI